MKLSRCCDSLPIIANPTKTSLFEHYLGGLRKQARAMTSIKQHLENSLKAAILTLSHPRRYYVTIQYWASIMLKYGKDCYENLSLH